MSYASLAQRFRVPLGFVLGALYLWLAQPTPATLAVGGGIALVGLLVRAWAAGHIVKNNQLATTGPYAHTRNPLYFGSFLIAAGFALIGHWALLLLVIAFFALVYAPVIEREREHIRARFPEAYAEWERHVPSFVPRPLPWRGGASKEGGRFSLALYMRHKEWRAAIAYVAVLAFLTWRMRNGVQ
ncbi:MAG TPA: isoprenylcysteine carboxylmethyltransferase family protein [Gemmatimonadaceae bacterium]|nr:isoprenylcysteine carboxylmethyltransferase family protein [Gemmatimonadaceae bacterium]